MHEMLQELAETISLFSPEDGIHPSPVPGVCCIKFSHVKPRAKRQWRACLGIVAQGSKEIVLGRKLYRCGAAHYTATPIHLPVIGRVSSATPEKPLLALLIDFDSLVINEVAAGLEKDFPKENTSQAMFVGTASDKMLEATVRLSRLFKTPEDARVLGPLVVKEMFYHLLKSENGPAIHQFVRSGSKMHKVSQAIHALRSELEHDVDVSALAKAANMSRSAFFKHFKEATAVSPIQYQKRLRLLEARRLMIEQGQSAEGSAFKVGYKSASQFSREYSRMFGDPPLQNAVKIKRTANSIPQI